MDHSDHCPCSTCRDRRVMGSMLKDDFVIGFLVWLFEKIEPHIPQKIKDWSSKHPTESPGPH